mgnify:FL=1|jgi:RNA polymerase sigma-70 factor, ECF subfamily
MDSEDKDDAHEQFTRLLLGSEPVMMRSILVIVPHQDDAREIMQETAVALWRQFDSYDPARPFINWAMGFSRIHTRRFLARQQKRATLTSEAAKVLEQEMERHPERTNTISQHLAHCLQKLPDQQQRLIQGYYHDDRSPQWLSQKEGRSVDAIYKTIQRTRQDLQTCIEKQLRKEFS